MLAGVVLFGSRHLVTRFVPAVGEFVAFPGSAGDLVREWVGGYRSVGLGADASAPTLVGVAGGLGAVLGGHLALARTLLIVGLVPVGVVGAYRLLRPTGSKPAQVAAAVAYAAVPLPYDGLATGRWSVTAAYAASPWLLGRLARSSRVPPFSPDGPVPVAPRPLWQDVVAAGTVTGLAGLARPAGAGAVVARGRRAGGGHSDRLPGARHRAAGGRVRRGGAGGDHAAPAGAGRRAAVADGGRSLDGARTACDVR